MGLKLDYDKLMKDYINNFYSELDWALHAWEAEVYSHTKSSFALKHKGWDKRGAKQRFRSRRSS